MVTSPYIFCTIKVSPGEPKKSDQIRQTNHKISSDHLSLLHVDRKGRRLDLLEAYEINKAQKQALLNVQLDLCHSNIRTII